MFEWRETVKRESFSRRSGIAEDLSPKKADSRPSQNRFRNNDSSHEVMLRRAISVVADDLATRKLMDMPSDG